MYGTSILPYVQTKFVSQSSLCVPFIWLQVLFSWLCAFFIRLCDFFHAFIDSFHLFIGFFHSIVCYSVMGSLHWVMRSFNLVALPLH